MNEGIHLDLDTWIVPGQILKANLCWGLGNSYKPAGTEVAVTHNTPPPFQAAQNSTTVNTRSSVAPCTAQRHTPASPECHPGVKRIGTSQRDLVPQHIRCLFHPEGLDSPDPHNLHPGLQELADVQDAKAEHEEANEQLRTALQGAGAVMDQVGELQTELAAAADKQEDAESRLGQLGARNAELAQQVGQAAHVAELEIRPPTLGLGPTP